MATKGAAKAMRFRRYLLPSLFFLGGILALAVVGKSLLALAAFSIAIVLGALIIAWAAESSQLIISEAFALAIVAWLQVFPEFMIEATIAWARDIPNMLSNFTGANRILVGVGWPLVFFVTSAYYKKKHGKFLKEIKLSRDQCTEIVFFLAATLYSVVVFLRGALNLFDTLVMGSIYIAYLWIVFRLPAKKNIAKLVTGMPKKIIGLKKACIKPVIAAMFLLGGGLIYFAADPFYHSALALTASLGISSFLFIQWIAPFLSEFPEKTSAFYWASKVKTAPMALMNLISSKLAQWTLLLAMIPVVYSASAGAISQIPLSSVVAGTSFTVATEFLLTTAKSFYASTFLLKMRFTWLEATSLLLLWGIQFVWVAVRPVMVWVYFGLAALELIVYRSELAKAFTGFRHIMTHLKG